MKKHRQQTIRISGKGNSKQKACAVALMSIQREVLKNSSNIMLRVEPVGVNLISASEEVFTEKFLFFFFPRKRICYSIVLDVTVEISFVDINEINFT